MGRARQAAAGQMGGARRRQPATAQALAPARGARRAGLGLAVGLVALVAVAPLAHNTVLTFAGAGAASSRVSLVRPSPWAARRGAAVARQERQTSVDDVTEAEAEAQVQQMYKEASKNLMERGARIVIMGATGTGKTSVLNAAFNETKGRVSHGIPCTQEVEVFAPTQACPVWIYDTKGFEPLSNNQNIFDGLRSLRDDRMAAAKKHDPQSPRYHAERLHAVWWVTAERFEPECAKRVYETFGEEIPIFVIVNKCDKDPEEVDAIMHEVSASCPWAVKCVPVVAMPKNGPLKKQCPACHGSDISVNEKNGWFMCGNDLCHKSGQKQQLQEQYGIDDLLSSTAEHLPELVAHSFLVAEREYLQDLDTQARNRIVYYAGIATAIGMTPIPGSDFPLLFANECMMFRKLASIYGLKVDRSSVRQVISAMSSVSLGALLGFGLGSGLKAIPGLNVLGATLSGIIAGCVTWAIGMTTRELLRRVRRLAVFGEVSSEHFFRVMHVDEMKDLFKRYFEERFRSKMKFLPGGP